MTITNYLRQGSCGSEVDYLIEALTQLGYFPGQTFDERTEEAVKEFQRDFGLKEDGIVGAMTAKAIHEAVNNLPLPPGRIKLTREDVLRVRQLGAQITDSIEQVASICGRSFNRNLNGVSEFTVRPKTIEDPSLRISLKTESGASIKGVCYIDPPGICTPCSLVIAIRATV